MRAQKDTSSVFSLPLETLERLPEEEFAQAAGVAGVTVERFREILARTRQVKAADIAAKKEAAERESQANTELRRIPHYARIVLRRMKVDPSQLAEVEAVETAAYELADIGDTSKAYAKFLEYQKVVAGHRLYELCRHHELRQALAIFQSEKRGEERRRQNIPACSTAIRDVCARILQEVEDTFYRPEHRTLDIFGPGEVFSANIPLNFPRHPRPRRSNDELEPF